MPTSGSSLPRPVPGRGRLRGSRRRGGIPPCPQGAQGGRLAYRPGAGRARRGRTAFNHRRARDRRLGANRGHAVEVRPAAGARDPHGCPDRPADGNDR